MKSSWITAVGTVTLVLVGILIAKAVLTKGAGIIVVPFAFMLAGFGLGTLLAYIGNRFPQRVWQLIWLLLSLILLFAASLMFGNKWDIQPSHQQNFVTFYLTGHLLTSSLTKTSRSAQSKEKKPSLRDDTVSAMIHGGTDAAIVGGGCGVILFLLIKLWDVNQVGPIPLLGIILLPAVVGGCIGALQNRESAKKRQAAMIRNPELAALFYRLGDGVRYDVGARQATFRSQESADVFRQTAPDWQVKYVGKQKNEDISNR